MKRVRLSSQVRKAFQGSSRGLTLIEVLIALALVGVIAITVLSGLSTASMALITADERATAESLARSQLEYVKNQEYIDYSLSGHEDYDGICDVIECEDYTVEVIAEPIDPETGEPYPYIEGEGRFEQDDGIQKITVTVSRDDPVITLEGYKRAA